MRNKKCKLIVQTSNVWETFWHALEIGCLTWGLSFLPCLCSTAEVIGDKMYLLACKYPISIDIYCLDLKTWRWDKIAPGGVQPSKISNGVISSWAHKERVYCLAGRRDKAQEESGLLPEQLGLGNNILSSTNQLICFNTSTNRDGRANCGF